MVTRAFEPQSDIVWLLQRLSIPKTLAESG